MAPCLTVPALRLPDALTRLTPRARPNDSPVIRHHLLLLRPPNPSPLALASLNDAAPYAARFKAPTLPGSLRGEEAHGAHSSRQDSIGPLLGHGRNRAEAGYGLGLGSG